MKRRLPILFLSIIVVSCTPFLLMKLGEKGNPYAMHTDLRYLPPGQHFYFGTDSLGRNMTARSLYAAGLSFKVALESSALSLVLALILGGTAGYTYGKWPEKMISWLVSFAYTVPMMFIVVAVFAVVEPGIERAYLVIGCIGWVAPARLVRAEVVRLRSSPFVRAERAFGKSEVGVFTSCILPLCFQPAITSSLYYLPELIGLEVGLSFFGLSAQPPTPTLGRLIFDSLKEFPSAWWLALLPFTLLLLMIIILYTFAQIVDKRKEGYKL